MGRKRAKPNQTENRTVTLKRRRDHTAALGNHGSHGHMAAKPTKSRETSCQTPNGKRCC